MSKFPEGWRKVEKLILTLALSAALDALLLVVLLFLVLPEEGCCQSSSYGSDKICCSALSYGPEAGAAGWGRGFLLAAASRVVACTVWPLPSFEPR